MVEVDRYGGSGTGNGHQISDNSIRLAKGGTISGNDKSTGAIWPASDTNTYVSYGNATDLWGLNWTPADVNGSGFGAVISAIKGNGNSLRTAYVDHIRITVYYTLVATASSNSPLCEGATIQLYGGPNGMTSYNWTGPGGWTSSAQNATRTNATLAMAGNYTLMVTDSSNSTATNTTTVVVNAAPTAAFSSNVTSGCAPLSVQFTDTSTGSPTTWSWSFGDGGTSILQSPTHQYNSTGSYNVSLTASNGCGNDTKTVTNYITVYSRPTATASSNSPVCEGATIQLYGGPNGMTTYSWTGPGGWTSNAQNATRTGVTLAMAGAYTLIVTNGGCTSDPVTTNVTVNAKPTATASSNSPVFEGATIELYGGPDGMTTYSWTGPGGFSSSAQNATRSNATLAMTGTYTLTVTNSNGCSDDESTSVIVNIVTYNVSGYIRVDSTPLPGVLVTAHSPWTGQDITDANGEYVLTGVPYGETNIVLTPTLAGYAFSPPTITVPGPMMGSLGDQNFTSTVAPCDYEGIAPTTYAKIPFAILESGLKMVELILGPLADTLGLPDWLDDVVAMVGPWTGGPLSWTVDMLGWDLSLMGTIVDSLAPTLGLPDWLGDLINSIVCAIFTPFTCNVTAPAFAPCG